MGQELNVARVFQIWMYTVGHGELLLRSTRTETFPSRVDVLFKNVSAMQLPCLLEGLNVSSSDDPAADRVEMPRGFVIDGDRRPFRLSGSNYDGIVIAGSMVWAEDELDYDEPSPLAGH